MMPDTRAATPKLASPLTALGYATILVRAPSSGVPNELLVLGLYRAERSWRGGRREFYEWRGAELATGRVVPQVLVSAVSSAHAVRTLRDAYGHMALRLWPLRTPAERAAAIAARVLTPETGTLTPEELSALEQQPPHSEAPDATS